MSQNSYCTILRLVWPLALGMVNNAVMQFVDGVFLAHESLASLEASLPASMLAGLVLCFFQSVVAAFGLWLPLVGAVAAWHNTMPALWGTMIVYVVVICCGTLLRWKGGRWRRIRLV